MGIHAHMHHHVHTKVQRQLMGVDSFLQPCGSQDKTQVIRFGSCKPSCWLWVLFYEDIKSIHKDSTSQSNYLPNALPPNSINNVDLVSTYELGEGMDVTN